MIIGVDRNQITGSHKKSNAANHRKMTSMGHKLTVFPIPFGDYIQVTPEIEETVKRRGMKLKTMDIINDIKVAVDRKNSIDEICGNLCSSREAHERFRDECITAQKAGARFYILVENEEGIRDVHGITKWSNPRLHRYNKIKYMHSIGKWQSTPLPGKRPPCDNIRLMKTMITMSAKYNVNFIFCSPYESADRIVELLGGTDEQGKTEG